jgi:hypothetical protein
MMVVNLISKSGLSIVIVVIVSHFRRSFHNVLLFFLTPRSWNSKEEKFIPRDVSVFFSITFGSCAINESQTLLNTYISVESQGSLLFYYNHV